MGCLALGCVASPSWHLPIYKDTWYDVRYRHTYWGCLGVLCLALTFLSTPDCDIPHLCHTPATPAFFCCPHPQVATQVAQQVQDGQVLAVVE